MVEGDLDVRTERDATSKKESEHFYFWVKGKMGEVPGIGM